MNTEKKRTRANGEGTIFKNRNRWTVACYDIHGIRRTQSFKKKIEAETWLVEQVTARKRFKGTYVVNPKQTVEEYLNNWLPTQRHLIRPNSTRFYASTIKNQMPVQCSVCSACGLPAAGLRRAPGPATATLANARPCESCTARPTPGNWRPGLALETSVRHWNK